ncbi:MAG: nuclear transport factor 2 family protein [Myxococcota bacterium]
MTPLRALPSALCLALLGCGATQPAGSAESSRDVALAGFEALLVDFDVDAARARFAPDYIQHNPAVPTGAEAAISVIPALAESGLRSTVHRVIAEDDLVVLHVTYENAGFFGAETLVSFDVFRVEGDRVVEHWDNLQAPPATTVSGRSMTDGPTAITDLARTEANRAFVEEFAEVVLLGGAFDRLGEYITDAPGAYHQHNPGIGDGLDGLVTAFTALEEAGQALVYTRIHRVVAEGNFVFWMAEGTLGGVPTAFFDLFRLEDGKIVEHWDTVATIPPPEDFAHANGKF